MLTITRKFIGSGVYCILNTVNQKRYVGSSNNCYLRLMDHRAELRSNVHANKHLQNAFNKYGENVFVCFVLEFCDESIRLEKEKYYIDLFNAEYNIIKNPTEIIISDESRHKMSISRKNGFKNGTIVAYQQKQIHKYDLDGNYICSYKSQKQACESVGINQCTIIRYFANNYKQCAGYQWSYEKVDKMPKYIKPKKDNSYNNKSVIVTNINNNEKIYFQSVKDCAKYFNVTPSLIGYRLKVKTLYKGKYMIEFETAV